MMAPSKIRRIGVVALLCLGIAVGAGCKKQRASLNLKKLKDIISEADANQADTFDKKEFDDVKKLVDAAQNAYNGEQFAPAYDQSRGAIQAAETMLENVKKARAAFLQTQAADDIKIAQDNNGQQQDPQRYQAILQANDKGKQRYTKSDWDGAIQSFLQVVSGVDELLAPIKLQAEQRLTEIKVSVKTMETEGVRQHAVQLGLDVDELVKTVEDLIQNKRQYVTAQTVMSRTEQAVAAAIEEAKRVRSLILINEIETDLGVALQYGAEVFFRQRIEQDAEAYTNILSAYEDRKYDNALQAAAILKPRAADLRYETRKRSAETKAKSVQDMIAKLEEGGAREYLPGSVEILDQMLKDAQTQIATGEEKGFDQAEQIAEAASEEQQKILADFNELANKAISESAKELDIATEVFRATDRIFDLAVPAESANDLERQLETNKQAMKAEIGALLDAARTTLGTAQLKRDSQQYRDSILLAEDIKKTAKIIQDETYRVAAHNSLLEIESQVTHYSAEGEQYAPKELAEARRLLGETRALIETGESKKAVDEAALAKAQLDVLKQDLSARGAQGIVEAQKALAEALDHKALQYAADQTAQAKKDLEDAIAARNLFDYRQVIERTRDAKALAEAARAAADREAAATQIESADARFQRAAQAYGALFSPRNYKDAGDKLSAARQMFAGEKYVEARQLAVEAADLADSAAFERVIDAEQQIATAKRDEAWRYASRKMADAINAAKDARASADAGDFDSARASADQSIRLAKEADVEAKNTDVSQRLSDLRQGVDNAVGHGANNFQVQEVKELTDKIAEVETKYQTNQYEETAKELRDMEARLEELLVNTPAVLERAVAEQTARRQAYLDGPIDLRIYAGQQLDESEKELSYAKMDFGKGQYRQSYTNLRQAMRLLDEVQGILETSQYNAQVAQMFDDFTQAQDNFRSILSISETALVDLAVNNPDGKAMALAVSGDTGPGLFRDAVEKIYTQAKALKPPPSKATTHDQVLQLFLMARRAAMNFEKLTILDQFDKKTAREIIEQGFDQLKAARRQQQEIEKTFREPGVDSMIVRTRKAIGVQLY